LPLDFSWKLKKKKKKKLLLPPTPSKGEILTSNIETRSVDG
jgi:hypothetical protein